MNGWLVGFAKIYSESFPPGGNSQTAPPKRRARACLADECEGRGALQSLGDTGDEGGHTSLRRHALAASAIATLRREPLLPRSPKRENAKAVAFGSNLASWAN